MSFTGLAPDAVATLAASLRAAARALDDSAGTVSSAANLSGLGDSGLVGRAVALATTLRRAATTLDARAGYLGGFKLPAIDEARRVAATTKFDAEQQVPTPTSPPPADPPSHFMDDSIWLIASVKPEPHGAIPLVPGTTWGVNYEGDIFGEVGPGGADLGWSVDARVLPSGEVDLRFGNSATVELIGGTPKGSALDGTLEGGLSWRMPPSWLATNLLSLLPNTGEFSRTYRFESVEEFETFWTVFTYNIGVGLGQTDPTDPAVLALGHLEFARLYDATYPDRAPVAQSLAFGQQLELRGQLDLTPLDALASGGTGNAATDAFLSRLAGALHGELNGSVEYGVEVDGRLVPGYHAPGSAWPLSDGWSDTIWLRLHGEAELLVTARTLLWGQQVGDQIKGEIRSGLVLDRWGQPRQVVLKATVAGYQFDDGSICVPLAGQGWLTIDVDGRPQFTQKLEDDIVMTNATLRVIEFQRTIDLWPDRAALARELITLELNKSGIERLNLAILKYPEADDRLGQARAELDDLLAAAGQPAITDEQWLALLNVAFARQQELASFGGYYDVDRPSELIPAWAAATGNPLTKVDAGAFSSWAADYLNPVSFLTQPQYFTGFLHALFGGEGLSAEDDAAEVNRRMDELDTPEKLDAYLAANGVNATGWEITTYQGLVGTTRIEGAADIAENAALAVAGGIESSQTKYWEIGHWTFTDAGYDEFMAGTATDPTALFDFLLRHNLTRFGPMPPYDAPAPTPAP